MKQRHGKRIWTRPGTTGVSGSGESNHSWCGEAKVDWLAAAPGRELSTAMSNANRGKQ